MYTKEWRERNESMVRERYPLPGDQTDVFDIIRIAGTALVDLRDADAKIAELEPVLEGLRRTQRRAMDIIESCRVLAADMIGWPNYPDKQQFELVCDLEWERYTDD